MSIRYLSGINVDNNVLFVDSANNRVGIGTSMPEQKLHVEGIGLMAVLKNSSAGVDEYSQIEFAAGNRRGYIWLGNENTSSWAGAGGLNIYTANGNMDLWTGANQRVRITNGGNVLIGTTTDSGFKLDVAGTFHSGGDATFNGTNTYINSSYIYVGNNTGDLVSISGSTMYFPGNGNVGIGTAAPASVIHVSSTGANSYSSTITKGSNMKGIVNTLSNNADDMVGIYFGTGTDAAGSHWSGITGSRSNSAVNWGTQLNFYTHNDDFSTITDATQKMVIKGNGNVGIGTASPQSRLDLSPPASQSTTSTLGYSANAQLNIRIPNSVGDIGQIVFTNDAAPTAGYASIGVVMTSGAGVGVGDIIMATKAIGSDAVSNERMRITSGGNVLIGTATDSGFKLLVNGTAYISSILAVAGDGNGTAKIGAAGFGSNYTGISLNGTLSTGSYNFLSSTSDNHLYINRPTGNNIYFRVNNSDQMAILSSGNVGINTESGFNSVSGTETTLHISNSNVASLYLSATGGSGNKYAIYSSSGGALQVFNVTQNNYPLGITSGGNVLINTTTDSGYKLAVAGNAVLGYAQNRPVFYDSGGGNFQIKASAGGWATGYFFQGSSGTFLGGWGGYGGNDALGYLWAGDAYNTPTMVVYGAQGNVGIGTTEPSNKLTVTRSAATAGQEVTYGLRVVQGKPITIGGDNDYAYIQSWSSGPLSINAQGNNVLFPNANSNVIIGTTTDTGGVKLQVAPSAGTWVSGTFSGNGGTDKFVVGNYNGRVSIGGHNSALNAWAAMSLNFDGGNIQIGTLTDNGRKLNVNGDIFASGEFYSNQYASARYIRYNWNTTNFAVGAGIGIRWVIGRIYWNQVHWGHYSGMDIEIVWNYYNGARKKYTISNGAGGGGIYLRESQSYGSAYARVSLGSAVDTGTTSGGYSNFYQDVYLDVNEYNQVSVNGELKGPQISIDKTSIGGGEYGWATFFSSPSASNISAFTNQAATILSSEGNWGYIDNKLGINNSNPSGTLHVQFNAADGQNAVILRTQDGGGNGVIRWQNNGATNQAGIGSNYNVGDNGALEFLNGATTNMMLRGNGNVLIGTTTDNGYKLRVNGKGYFDNNVVIAPTSESWAEGLSFVMPTTGTWGGLRWRRERVGNDGNWYIGYTALDSTDDLVFGANNGGTQVNNIIRLTKAGNVGIGTTNPLYRLDVTGSARVNSTSNLVMFIKTSSSFGAGISYEDSTTGGNDVVHAGAIGSNFYIATGYSEQMRVSSSGNVIIGSTTDAGYKLDVHGEILGRDDIRILNTYALILNGTDANWRIGRNTITDSGWLTGNTMQMVVFGGQTGQGFQVVNTNGTALFEIDGVAGASRFTNALGVGVNPSGTAGRIDASNDIVAYSTSDQRLKENITPIANALDKVKSLTGVEFDWKEETKAVHGYEGHDVGVIAQEVQAVLPEAVRTNDSGYLSVRYEKMIGLLVEAMKEQQNQIDELKAKLDGLTK